MLEMWYTLACAQTLVTGEERKKGTKMKERLVHPQCRKGIRVGHKLLSSVIPMLCFDAAKEQITQRETLRTQ